MDTEFIYIGAVAGGCLTLFTFLGVTWKLLRFIFRVDNALPTMLNIASQFESNHGSTIKDKIDHIASGVTQAASIAETAKLVAETNAKIVQELTSTQTTELLHFRDYLHQNMHAIRNEMAKFTLGLFESNQTLRSNDNHIKELQDKLKELEPFLVRKRGTDETR